MISIEELKQEMKWIMTTTSGMSTKQFVNEGWCDMFEHYRSQMRIVRGGRNVEYD